MKDYFDVRLTIEEMEDAATAFKSNIIILEAELEKQEYKTQPSKFITSILERHKRLHAYFEQRANEIKTLKRNGYEPS